MKRHRDMWRSVVGALCTVALVLPGAADGAGSDLDKPSPNAPRDADYLAGVAAAQRNDWAASIARMKAAIAREPHNADAWNYLGLAYRNLGRPKESFRYFEQALRLDPQHLSAHESLGEAYLQVGDLALAEVHLRALQKLCAMPCKDSRELEAQVQAYKRDNPR